MRIAAAIDTARRTRRIIRQNLAWAVGYNLLALPLAATGQVVPWMAALAMVLSSLTVTLNALRLARGSDGMNILLLLIPLSLVLLVVMITAFVWAVRNGQFDDLDTPPLDILADKQDRG